MGTPDNVSKDIIVLQEKDIVEIQWETILLNDPVFEYWFKQVVNKCLQKSGL